ncbi:hypothetical protein [Chryseobacterium sp.]|uniref:hypothetical protein n=1 Tax=Chryseobacterium sp. TaxID=1871047 RepID=UPI0025C49144|nr:hypothetical protein [Chryseobacterium sp.]
MDKVMNAELLITKEGNFNFNNNSIIVDPKTITPEECEKLLSDWKRGKSQGLNNGYIWQDYTICFENENGILSFCFYEKKLECVSINVSLKDIKLIDGWPTEESSRKEISFIKKAFKKQFNGQLQYGKPFHIFDKKGFSASCGISYNEYIQKPFFTVELKKKVDSKTHFINITANGRSFYTSQGILNHHNLLISDLTGENITYDTHESARNKADEIISEYTLKGFDILN